MRWSDIAIRKRTANRNTNPPVVNRIKSTKPVRFNKALLKINKLKPIAFKPFAVLDPSKKVPTPVDSNKIFKLPNNETLTAKEYYAELNRLEKEYNKLGYSLDLRKQPKREINFASIPKTSKETVRVRRREVPIKNLKSLEQDYVKRTNSIKMQLRNSRKKSVAPGTFAGKKSINQASQKDTKLPSQKVDLPTRDTKLKPRPYNKTLNISREEFGARDSFGAYMEGRSALDADPGRLNIVNTAEFGAYVFGNEIKLMRLTGHTSASYSGGRVSYNANAQILGNNFPIVSNNRSVPSMAPADMSTLPQVSSGYKFYNKSLDAFRMSYIFMAGPIPIVINMGVAINVGTQYTLAANPLFTHNVLQPYARADMYAQAGIDLLIVAAYVENNVTLIDATFRQQCDLARLANENQNIIAKYKIEKDYTILSGRFAIVTKIVVPAFDIPPWHEYRFTTTMASFAGTSATRVIADKREQISLFQ